MALTNLQLLRLRVGDKARNFTEQAIGDGTSKIFQLTNFPASSASVYVAGSLKATPADYTLSGDDGRLTMITAPANAAAVVIVGSVTLFSDTELNDILDRQGGVHDAVLEVLQILMVDAGKRIRWATNQGLEVDESMMAKNLKLAYDTIAKTDVLAAETSFADGGLESWPANQEDY